MAILNNQQMRLYKKTRVTHCGGFWCTITSVLRGLNVFCVSCVKNSANMFLSEETSCCNVLLRHQVEELVLFCQSGQQRAHVSDGHVPRCCRHRRQCDWVPGRRQARGTLRQALQQTRTQSSWHEAGVIPIIQHAVKVNLCLLQSCSTVHSPGCLDVPWRGRRCVVSKRKHIDHRRNMMLQVPVRLKYLNLTCVDHGVVIRVVAAMKS